MPRCKNCDGHVTRQFARVFGDNEDDVYRCRECATSMDLFHNGGVPPGEESSGAASDGAGRAAGTWDRDGDWT